MSNDRYDPTSLANPVAPDFVSDPGPAAEPLLEQIRRDPKGASQRVLRDWDETTRLWKPLFAQWKINRARNAGYTGMRLIKVQNEARAFFPIGSVPSQTTTNKGARLTRRLRSTIFTDPATPEAVPVSDDDQDRDTAETSTRILADVCGNHNLAYNLASGDAFDLASMHGSGFIRFWIDPQGGGRDVRTGAWLPKVQRELLTGRNVRLLPTAAADIWEATGAMVGALVPVSVLRNTVESDLSHEEWMALSAFRPTASDELLPIGRKDRRTDEQDPLAFALSVYHLQSPEYPVGCYAMLVGGRHWVVAGPWQDPQRGSRLDLPITQFKQIPDEDNPYGRGMWDFLGPGNEVRASLEASIDEHLRRFSNRKTFVPMHSNLQPEQLQAETRTYLPIVPNGQPVNEDVPDFPQPVMLAYDLITREMDDESGLQETGQGLAPSSVRSGTHAQAIVSQVNVGLSDLAAQSSRAIERGWTIILQQIRAFVSGQLIVRWQSESGEYKVRRWEAADLGATTDVRITKGSFSQMSSLHKAEVISTYTQSQLLNPADAQHMVTNQVGALVGLQDNPYRQRVRRQISEWEMGPPPGWVPLAGQDPMTGQPIPDPALEAIWAPLPVDDQPDVATIRVYELGRSLSGVKASKKPEPWRARVVGEYERARVSAGIQTVAEQQQAAQQQAEAQQAAAQQQQAEQQAQEQAKDQAVQQLAQAVEQQLSKITQQLEQIAQDHERDQAQDQQKIAVLAKDLAMHVQLMRAEMANRDKVDRAQATAQEQTARADLAKLAQNLEHRLSQVADAAKAAVPTPRAPAPTPAPVVVTPTADPAALAGAITTLAAALEQKPAKFTVTRDGEGLIKGITEEGT